MLVARALEEEIDEKMSWSWYYQTLTEIDLTDPAVEAAAVKMEAAFKMKGKKKFGKNWFSEELKLVV